MFFISISGLELKLEGGAGGGRLHVCILEFCVLRFAKEYL